MTVYLVLRLIVKQEVNLKFLNRNVQTMLGHSHVDVKLFEHST